MSASLFVCLFVRTELEYSFSLQAFVGLTVFTIGATTHVECFNYNYDVIQEIAWCGSHVGKKEKLWTSVSLKPHEGKN